MKIEDLGPIQLWKLRKDVVVNSMFLWDYENRYGIGPSEVRDFFDGYLDFLEELMKEDYPSFNDYFFWSLFPEYDTKKNLLRWWFCWIG